jgi:hypothetical protein
VIGLGLAHPALVQTAQWLADDSGSGESKKSGPIGLAVIIVLCVVCYFLFKSMSKHMKKVREEFPDPGPGAPSTGDGSAAATDRAAVPRAQRDDPTPPGEAPEL